MYTIVRVLISPLADIDKFGELLKGGKDTRTYLFRGITSRHLRDLFQEATRKISGVSFTRAEQEEDIFQADYRISLKREIYAAAENLNRTCNGDNPEHLLTRSPF